MPFKPIYRLMMSIAVLVLILYVCRRIYYTSRQTISIDSIPSGHAIYAIGVSPAAPTPDITFYDKHSKYCVCAVCMCSCVHVCVGVCGGYF